MARAEFPGKLIFFNCYRNTTTWKRHVRMNTLGNFPSTVSRLQWGVLIFFLGLLWFFVAGDGARTTVDFLIIQYVNICRMWSAGEYFIIKIVYSQHANLHRIIFSHPRTPWMGQEQPKPLRGIIQNSLTLLFIFFYFPFSVWIMKPIWAPRHKTTPHPDNPRRNFVSYIFILHLSFCCIIYIPESLFPIPRVMATAQI